MPDTFESLRPRIVDYLHERGIDLRKRFRCLNPQHLDRDPSMGFDPKRNKVHCFACGADYDLFDLLTMDNNLSTPLEALILASKQYGDGSAERPAKRDVPESEGRREGGSAPPFLSEESFSSSYLDDCFSHRTETDYFTARGLSADTIARFRLGYDPKHDCVVLPCEGGHCIRRSVTEKRYLNEKGQPSPLFQPELLLSQSPLVSGSARSLAPQLPTANAPLVCGGSPVSAGKTPVFLLEGAFDALSAEELGYHAAALNGSGNREKAAALLRQLDVTSSISSGSAQAPNRTHTAAPSHPTANAPLVCGGSPNYIPQGG